MDSSHKSPYSFICNLGWARTASLTHRCGLQNLCKMQLCGRCAGFRPLSESYCAVITAFVDNEQDDVGQAILDSMMRAGLDPRPGWLALTKACIRKGYDHCLGLFMKIKLAKSYNWAGMHWRRSRIAGTLLHSDHRRQP